MAAKLVEMNGINKSFPNVKAIDNGKFDLYPGEIHSLIGENGAGKSTMMKILYGMYAPDSGTIKVKGNVLEELNPKQAINYGIGMVHQEFMLVKELTVLENIILGFEPQKNNRIDFAKAREKIQYYIESYGLEIQPNKKVIDISVGEAQRVEIIKTLYRGADILILDEPTAVLTPQETVKLFEILNSLKNDGKSIVFISHKLNEVMEISDRITVMRHGEYIDTVNKKDTSIPELAKMMVGRAVFLNIKREAPKIGDTVLSVKNIYVSGEKEISKLRDVSFEVRSGEIVGIAGVDGNGQSGLVEAITGLRGVEKGDILLKGKSIKNLPPLKIRQAGIAHIPEDRNVRGLNRDFSIQENLIGNRLNENPYATWIKMNEKEIGKYAEKLIKDFDIRPSNKDISAKNLSGGNAQKIVVAREVDMHTDLLIAAQPTRGVDIGAIEAIRKTLNQAKEAGTAILLVSADLEEILSLSDRIVVMYEGKITGILQASEATEERVGLLMTGGELDDKKSIS
ncbi:ABC transporter ATP-binding protein [Maledivibacter halophilus]|uniref:Nucleoside ABC transporter ATP-binding protein n=1 Tax=Maledivibacter halophilus TaxID=36842 RepID=A0A1T5M5P7_9FIRM|nr:ABC transporter ATP-binding protein [Maledivibacter halophilus]SKC83557.1 nucleoside ABC transporter ATP-binding protein [Maledivibacter halophilus]